MWNQGEVRRGVYRNSHLELFVEKDGIYQFELRRWPKEADLRITEGIDGDLSDLNDWYTGGKALDIVKAKIKIGDFEEEKEVTSNDKFITFKAALKKGDVDLQTWFYDKSGDSLGAYYVYAEYIGE